MSALTNQNAALEAQLRGKQNIAQGLAELPGAITTVAWESHQCSLAKKKTSTCGPRMLRTTCQVFPNVRGALSVAVESHDVVTAAAVAIGVLELDAETSAEIDGQLFMVLSALTDCESFHVVTSAGGDRGFESVRKLHKHVGAVQGGTCTKSLAGDFVPTASEVA